MGIVSRFLFYKTITITMGNYTNYFEADSLPCADPRSLLSAFVHREHCLSVYVSFTKKLQFMKDTNYKNQEIPDYNLIITGNITEKLRVLRKWKP